MQYVGLVTFLSLCIIKSGFTIVAPDLQVKSLTFVERHVAQQQHCRDDAYDVSDGNSQDRETRLPDVEARLVLMQVV